MLETVQVGPRLLRNINGKSQVPDWSASVPITWSDVERREAGITVFFRQISIYTPVYRSTNSDQIRQGQAHPLSQGAELQRSPIFGVPSTYVHTLWRRTTTFGVVTQGACFMGSAPPGMGSAAGRKFLAPPYYSQRAVFASPLSAFFIEHIANVN